MRVLYGRVAFFPDFRHCKMRCCFEPVLKPDGRVLRRASEAFWTILGGFWWFVKRGQISRLKLKAEKVVLEPRKSVRPEVTGGSGGLKKSFQRWVLPMIVGYCNLETCFAR